MTEQTVRAHARCEECHRGYRVSNPDRTYVCKACGGVVRVDEAPEAPHEHLRSTSVCSECQAISPHGGAVCAECGAALEAPPSQKGREKAVEDRREAMRALRHGYQRMTMVAWIYRAGALAYTAVTLVAVLALARPDVPRDAGILVVGVTTVLTVLMIIGAMRVLFRPFVWTLTLAVLATGVSAVHLVGPDPMGLMLLWTAGWAVVFWITLASALRFRRLIAQHTDEYTLHHASLRTQRALKTQSGEERHERLLDVMRQASGRAWKISASAAVLISLASILGTYAVLSRVRPQELSASLVSFETAWNEGDFAAVGGLFRPQSRELKAGWLTGMAKGHGWQDSMPQLGEGRQHHTEDRVRVEYDAAGLALSTNWILLGRNWLLETIELPQPSLEPVLELFLQAWQRSDLEAIAAFFPASHQERWHESLVHSTGFRNWDDLPEVLETDTNLSPDGEMITTLRLEAGVVTTKWLFRREGRWGLQALQFPD